MPQRMCVQLLLALFLPSFLIRGELVYSPGREATAGDYYRGGRHADRLTALVGVPHRLMNLSLCRLNTARS